MQIIFAIIAGITGILVGGVINALADDLPARRNPRLPHYPDGTPRPPSAWLGLTAFLSGQREPRKRDRRSRATSPDPAENPAGSTSPARLRWRHPLVEIVMGASYAVLVLSYYGEARLWAYFAYVAILVLIAVIDIEHRLILFVVIIPSTLIALFFALVAPEEQFTVRDYLVGGALGFGFFYVLYLGGAIYVRLRGLSVVAFGFGDVMLAGVAGLILSWQPMIFATVITIMAGAAGSLLYMIASLIVGGRSARLKPLPYGPYIVLGTLLMLFARDEVQEFLRLGYE